MRDDAHGREGVSAPLRNTRRRAAAWGCILLAVLATAGLRWPRSVDGGPAGRVVTLPELARIYRLRPDARAPENQPALAGGRRLEFASNNRRLFLDGTALWMHNPLARHRARWAVSRADALELIDPLLRPALYLDRVGARRVLLDPGHGGEDGGTINGSWKEKDLTLDLARRVRARLVEYGFEVGMTRDSDVFIELEDRAAIAQSWGADLMISIHFNSSPDAAAQGLETYILSRAGLPSTNDGSAPLSARRRAATRGNQHDAPSAVLGYDLHRNMLRFTGSEDRGLRYARFLVLREAPCPAALVECGFLSHAAERGKILTEAHMNLLAQGISTGACQYLDAVLQARISPP